MSRSKILLIFLPVIVAFLFSAFIYPNIPDRVASHWDAAGNPNGYSSRAFTLFFVPVLMPILLGLILFFVNADPNRDRIRQFERQLFIFFNVFSLFFLYIHLLTVGFTLWGPFNFIAWFLPAIGVLMFSVASLLRHAQRNYTIGIRTPWTLASEDVWRKTHELGAKTFTIAAAGAIIGAFFPAFGFWIFFPLLILAALIPVVYSYILYRRSRR